MAQKIIQIQMRHLYFNLKDLFSNRKGFVILTSLLRFKNKSREFRELDRYAFAHCKIDIMRLTGTSYKEKSLRILI